MKTVTSSINHQGLSSPNKRSMNNEWEDIELQCPYTLHAQKKKKNKRISAKDHTLNPPAVPAFMMRSGCNAWIEA